MVTRLFVICFCARFCSELRDFDDIRNHVFVLVVFSTNESYRIHRHFVSERERRVESDGIAFPSYLCEDRLVCGASRC